jgi:integrase
VRGPQGVGDVCVLRGVGAEPAEDGVQLVGQHSAVLAEADVPDERGNGMHALRHFYASGLLDAGESVKAVSEYLGHADAGFTLRVYTHLMPSSHERTRNAVDEALGSAARDISVASDGG